MLIAWWLSQSSTLEVVTLARLGVKRISELSDSVIPSNKTR